MTKHLDRAASVLLRHVDTRPDTTRHASLRARIVERATAAPAGKSPSMVMWVFASVSLVFSIALLIFSFRQPPAAAADITFAVGSSQSPALAGEYLVSLQGAALPIRFSEGSVVVLQPAARGRVSSVSKHGARILLESGRARCDIVHRDGAEWAVTAGPYSVLVKGTSFEIAWDSSTGTLELQMLRGLVVLRGPGVESGLELSGTQRFVSRLQARAETPEPGASSAWSGGANASTDAAVELSVDPSAPAVSGTGVAAAGPSAAPSAAPLARVSWSELAAHGDYAAILSDAEQRGLETVLSTGSESDLAMLSDAARFRGRSDLAARALNATRSRFPGTSRAASAAYVLGRMADDAGQAVAALGWYDRYLSEAPGGPLAPEAMGRRMLLLRKTGNLSAARQAAELYLQRFPKGPYAGVAREMTAP